MSPARAYAPGMTFFCSGKVYTDCATQSRISESPHAVWPRSVFTSGPAAMTMRYGAMGRDSRHRVVVRARFPFPTVVVPARAPLATTVRPLGARTVHVTVALSLG